MAALAARPTMTANVLNTLVRTFAGGTAIGAGGGALVGAIVAAVTLGQPSGPAPWLPLALGLGGLGGIMLGLRFGGKRAGLLAQSAPLLGALVGLALGLYAWLGFRLVATGAAATLSGAFADAAAAVGGGATTGLLLGAVLGALVGLVVGVVTGALVALGAVDTRSLRLSSQY